MVSEPVGGELVCKRLGLGCYFQCMDARRDKRESDDVTFDCDVQQRDFLSVEVLVSVTEMAGDEIR